MAHYLHLTDGTSDIDLAVTGATGIALVTMRPAPPNRNVARVSGFPYVDGSRTVASALDDVMWEYTGMIGGTSADDVDSQLLALNRLLEQARLWEEQRVGTPVRLAFKRQGETNTSYRVVTGVPSMPAATLQDDHWIDIETIGNTLTFSMTLTLEPVAHASSLSTLLAPTVLAAPTGVTTAATTGTLAAGTYYFQVTASDGLGQTTPSAEVSRTLAAPGGITISWSAVAGATSATQYTVYGRVTGTGKQAIASTNYLTTTYTDTGAITPSGTMPGVNTTGTITNTVNADAMKLAAVPGGDSPAPLAITIRRVQATGSPWDHCWLGIVPIDAFGSAITNYQFSGTTDATSSSGHTETHTATGTAGSTFAQELNTYTQLQDILRYPWRVLLRAKATSGTATALQFRAQLFQVSSQTVFASTNWATNDGFLNVWRLLDLGTLTAQSGLLSRITQSNADLYLLLWYRTNDGSSVAFSLDYLEAVPYQSFVKLTGIYLDVGSTTVYESVAQDATGFTFPRAAPQTYTVDSTGLLLTNAARYGRVGKLPATAPANGWGLYVAGQTTSHVLTDRTYLTVKALPMYSLLRGAG